MLPRIAAGAGTNQLTHLQAAKAFASVAKQKLRDGAPIKIGSQQIFKSLDCQIPKQDLCQHRALWSASNLCNRESSCRKRTNSSSLSRKRRKQLCLFAVFNFREQKQTVCVKRARLVLSLGSHGRSARTPPPALEGAAGSALNRFCGLSSTTCSPSESDNAVTAAQLGIP